MYEILEKTALHPTVVRMKLYAPLVAHRARAGQFVIVRAAEDGERIPLTIASFDRAEGTVEIIFQTVGATTAALARLTEGMSVHDVAGPLGKPSAVEGYRRAVVVGGGVGCAIALPIARALHEAGTSVTSVIGFRSSDLVILEEDFAAVSDRVLLTTDDGSRGERGNVCIPLSRLIAEGHIDAVFAVGPLIMMKFVAETTRPFGIRTIASMNPIMIDGTGMCGCCRLTVGGERRFACIDGPEFDAHLVDFDEAMVRAKTYAAFEKRAREEDCNLFRIKE